MKLTELSRKIGEIMKLSKVKLKKKKHQKRLNRYRNWSLSITKTNKKKIILIFTTSPGNSEYSTPNGNIIKKTVSGSQVYSVKINKKFLEYLDDYETLEDKEGVPTGFYIKNDTLILYPTPDNTYTVEIEYLTLAIGEDDFGDSVYSLKNDNDTINIPEKYENIFKNALITKSMLYAIASEQDENYSGYKEQYDRAYKILINYTSGLKKEKRVYW